MKLKDYHTKKAKKNQTFCIPFIITYFKTTYVHARHNHHLGITTKTPIWRKHNDNSGDDSVIKSQIHCFLFFFVIIFPSGGYVSSVAQHQKKSYVWWWNRDYGEKDITALKAILLLSLFKCLHVLHPTGKVYSQRRLDMGGGGHVCWQFWTDTVVVILAHDSLLLYNPWTEEVKEEWRN